MSNAFLVLGAIYRLGLVYFAVRVMTILEPNTRLTLNWHHRAIVYQLERAYRGEVRRLIINQLPKTLKTHLVSVAYVAWLLLHDPSLWIAIICYDEELASTQLRRIRQILDSRWFRWLAPGTRIRKEKNTETIIETTAGGGVRALSIQGGITGHGFDFIIIDDPMKASLAYSETERRNLEELFSSAIANRWRDPSKGVLIVVMQRLHVDDFTAYLLRTIRSAVHLSIPAVAPHDMEFKIGENRTHFFQEGDLLEPDRVSEEVLHEMQVHQGYANFAAQYLQAPEATGGRIIDIDSIRDLVEPREPDYTIITIDPAFTKDGGDFSAMLVANFVGEDIELIYGEQVQLDFSRLGRWIRDINKKFEPDLLLIETIGAGKGLPAYLSSFDIDHVGEIRSHNGLSKIERMEIISPWVDAGHVWLPKSEPWAREFLRILGPFPHGPSEDWPDAFSQLVLYRDGVRAKARRQREERFPPEPPPERPFLRRGMHYRRWDLSW
jgi:hypothetical protein